MSGDLLNFTTRYAIRQLAYLNACFGAGVVSWSGKTLKLKLPKLYLLKIKSFSIGDKKWGVFGGRGAKSPSG